MRTNVEYKITTLFLILKSQIKSKKFQKQIRLFKFTSSSRFIKRCTKHDYYRTKNKIRTEIVRFKVAFLKRKRKI